VDVTVGDEFLSKVKGFKGVFVVHSNANPSAAAAAMGAMLARSKAAGAYFRVSDNFVPMIEADLAEESNSAMDGNQIEVDFKTDWVSYLRTTGLPAAGLDYNDSEAPERNTVRFLNAFGRRIPAIKPRCIHESSELSIPPACRSDYDALVGLLRNGGDLRPYLSRDILKKSRADRNDGLLNSWGIQHLHLRSEGSAELLFCVIGEEDAYLIQLLRHDAQHLWVDTQLVQILHDNWPALIARGRHDGLLPEAIPAARRAALRDYNANFAITVSDGTVYLPLAGGTMASGDSQEDWMNCDKIFWEIDHWQSIVSQNAAEIRNALHFPISKKLIVRMAFDNHDCCFYEPTCAVRLGGFER
jgi:hypothetical protein